MSWFGEWNGQTTGIWWGDEQEQAPGETATGGYSFLAPTRRPPRRGVEDDEAILIAMM